MNKYSQSQQILPSNNKSAQTTQRQQPNQQQSMFNPAKNYSSDNFMSQIQPTQSFYQSPPSKQDIIRQLEGEKYFTPNIQGLQSIQSQKSPVSEIKQYQSKGIQGTVNPIQRLDSIKESDNKEFQQVLTNLEKMQKELTQWKMKCKLIKLIAERPVNQEEMPDLDYETYRQLHKYDIELLNDYINQISQGLKDNIQQLQLIADEKKISPRTEFNEQNIAQQLTGLQDQQFKQPTRNFQPQNNSPTVNQSMVMVPQIAPPNPKDMLKSAMSRIYVNPQIEQPPSIDLLLTRAKIMKAKNVIVAAKAFKSPPPHSMVQQKHDKILQNQEFNQEAQSSPPTVELWSHAIQNLDNPPPLDLLINIEQKRQSQEKKMNILRLWEQAITNPLMNNPPPLELLQQFEEKRKERQKIFPEENVHNQPPPVEILKQIEEKRREKEKQERILFEIPDPLEKFENYYNPQLAQTMKYELNPYNNNSSMLKSQASKPRDSTPIIQNPQAIKTHNQFKSPFEDKISEQPTQKYQCSQKQEALKELSQSMSPLQYQQQSLSRQYTAIDPSQKVSQNIFSSQIPNQSTIFQSKIGDNLKDQKIQDLQAQLNTKNLQLQDLNNLIENHNINGDLIHTLKDHNASLFSDLENAQKKFQSLQNQLMNIEQITSGAYKHIPAKDLQIGKDSVAQQLQNLVKSVQDNKNYTDDLAETFLKLKLQLDKQEQQNDDYQMRNKELNFQLKEAAQEIEMIESKIDDQAKNTGELEPLYQRINDLEFQKQRLACQIDELQDQLEISHSEKQSLQEQIQQLEEKSDLQAQQIQNLVNNINALDDQLQQKNNIIYEISKDNNQDGNLLNDYNKLKKEYENNLQNIIQLKNIRDQYNNVIEQIQAQKNVFNQFEQCKEDMMKDRNYNLQQNKKLKEKLAEMEMYKSKYRIIKQELLDLKQKFNEYKQSFLKDVSDKFSHESEQFEGTMNMIRERFQSDSDSNKIEQQKKLEVSGISSMDSSFQNLGSSPDKSSTRKEKINKKLNELLGLKQKYEQAIDNIQDSLGQKGMEF